MAVNLGDLEQIAKHLEEEGEIDNVISDIEALRQRGPDLFTHEIHMMLDDAKIYRDEGRMISAAMALDDVINELKAKLREGIRVPGGKRRKTKKSRRGRKSHRKSLRQRK